MDRLQNWLFLLAPCALWLNVHSTALAASNATLLSPPCTVNQRVVECLAAHHAQLFEVDEERFARMLAQTAKEARRCKPLARTREFLELPRIIEADGWVAELFDDEISYYLKSKPKCFFDALAKAETTARAWLVRFFLKPSLHPEHPRHWIVATMQKYRDVPQYHDIMENYFADKTQQ